VDAAPHAAGRPRNDADTGPVYRGSSRKGVKESHVAAGERRTHVRFGNSSAKIDSQLVRALVFECRLLIGNRHTGLDVFEDGSGAGGLERAIPAARRAHGAEPDGRDPGGWLWVCRALKRAR